MKAFIPKSIQSSYKAKRINQAGKSILRISSDELNWNLTHNDLKLNQMQSENFKIFRQPSLKKYEKTFRTT